MRLSESSIYPWSCVISVHRLHIYYTTCICIPRSIEVQVVAAGETADVSPDVLRGAHMSQHRCARKTGVAATSDANATVKNLRKSDSSDR